MDNDVAKWSFETLSERFNNLTRELFAHETRLREYEMCIVKLKVDIPKLKQDIETLRLEMLKQLQKSPDEVLPKRRINV